MFPELACRMSQLHQNRRTWQERYLSSLEADPALLSSERGFEKVQAAVHGCRMATSRLRAAACCCCWRAVYCVSSTAAGLGGVHCLPLFAAGLQARSSAPEGCVAAACITCCPLELFGWCLQL